MAYEQIQHSESKMLKIGYKIILYLFSHSSIHFSGYFFLIQFL